MREKPANEKAVNNLIEFLKMVRFGLTGTPPTEFISKWQEDYQVAKRTKSDLTTLNIITKNADGSYKWNVGDNFRVIALRVLDHRLKKTKKTVHFPFPEFAGISDSLKEISQRLVELAVQNEKWLRTHKNPQITNEPADLFRVDDQRLYIVGQIASGIYKNVKICKHEFVTGETKVYAGDNFISGQKNVEAVCSKCGYKPNGLPEFNYNDANEIIIEATDDLMNKLLKKDNNA
jgi:hypothetical protein